MTNCYGNLYHHRSDATVFSPQRSWHPWLRHPLHTDISVWPSHEGHAQAMLILPRGWPIPSPLFPIKGVSVNRLRWRSWFLFGAELEDLIVPCAHEGERSFRGDIPTLLLPGEGVFWLYSVWDQCPLSTLKHRLLTFCFKSRGIVMFSSWSLLGLPLTSKSKTRWWIFARRGLFVRELLKW